MKNMKKVTIRLGRDELLYDISNNAYVQADTMTDGSERGKVQTFDIAQDGNIDRVSRTMDLAFRECEAMLYPYTKRDMDDGTESDDTPDSPEVYVLDMNVPEGFAHGTLELLTDYIHEYMVCRVLEDWTSITCPSVSVAWRVKWEEVKKKMEVCRNFRFKRVRRTQTPF